MGESSDRAPTSVVVGRLAPSPTGGLHLGHARTFLIAWLAARSRGGRVILRIEDIDTTRVRPGATEAMKVDLAWLGLDWDEGPYVQSERMKTYKTVLECLKSVEAVYPCTCTRGEVARAASAPHEGDEGPIYPGTCAGRRAADAQPLGDRPFAWRFRMPSGSIGWNDIFQGRRIREGRGLGGDFILAREPFAPSYQLAVITDDLAMGVTQVIRGDDLVPSTPRQIAIAQALGSKPPEYGHVPLVTGPDGVRLAKRDGSIKLQTLREGGVDPLWLVGWLARNSGFTHRVEPTRPQDWIRRFEPGLVPRDPIRVDFDEVRRLTTRI